MRINDSQKYYYGLSYIIIRNGWKIVHRLEQTFQILDIQRFNSEIDGKLYF